MSPEGRARVNAILGSLSEESEAKRRANISKGLKGRKVSDATREAVRKTHTGRKHSPEERAKRSAALTGHKVSEETRAKIGRANRRDVHKTTANQRARTLGPYIEWREAVYKRDDWTCQKCGEKGGKLHSHHIVNFHKAPELRHSVDNGITLCVKHHRLFHKIYGNKNNTVEQIVEFMRH